MEITEISKWKYLGEFIRLRLKNPLAHPEFFGYLAFVVLGAGGIGMWYSWGHQHGQKEFDHVDLAMNMLGFSISTVAAGCIEIMFVRTEKLKNSLFMFSIILIALFFLSYFVTASFKSSSVYWLSIPMTILALIVWWIGNGTNSNLTDDFFDDQSDVTKALTEIIKKKHAESEK